MGPAQRPRGSARPRTCCPPPAHGGPGTGPRIASPAACPHVRLFHPSETLPRIAARKIHAELPWVYGWLVAPVAPKSAAAGWLRSSVSSTGVALRSQLLCAELDAGRAAIAVMASALCAAAGGSLCSELTACMHACTRSHPHARARAHTHMPRMHACAASACTHRCAEDPRGESRVVCAYRFMQQNWNPRVHAVPLIPISPCCEFSVPRSRFVAVPKL